MDAADLTLAPQESQWMGTSKPRKPPPSHGTRHDSNKGPRTCLQNPTPLGHPSWGCKKHHESLHIVKACVRSLSFQRPSFCGLALTGFNIFSYLDMAVDESLCERLLR
ncbi:hypothetical protein SO802_021617 [Lithocarpus litseifolius]|uniref:Uncharacterized protein n=1 Tax=Lithocarpus litseifolius TaxID=425828 RepID=A0AAW2CFE2_9ROSI